MKKYLINGVSFVGVGIASPIIILMSAFAGPLGIIGLLFVLYSIYFLSFAKSKETPCISFLYPLLSAAPTFLFAIDGMEPSATPVWIFFSVLIFLASLVGIIIYWLNKEKSLTFGKIKPSIVQINS